MRRSTKTIGALAASLALALAATACAPGGSTTDDPAASARPTRSPRTWRPPAMSR